MPIMKDAEAILRRAEELIARGWVQAEAQDAEGAFVTYDDPTACSYCLNSAMLVAIDEHDWTSGLVAFEELAKLLDEQAMEGWDPDDHEYLLQSLIIHYNDTDLRTKEEVVSLVQAAIGGLGKEEASHEHDG